MLTLSLFLSAVAGVNAILSGKVNAVEIAENKWMCADDCTYGGGYFEQTGFWCLEKERVMLTMPDGTTNIHLPFGGCAGAPRRQAYLERPPSNGDKLPGPCVIEKKATECSSSRISSGNGKLKTMKWSEVEKQLKEAQAQNGQGSPKKPVDCTAEASKTYYKCQNEPDPSFDECYKQAFEAAEKCREQ